ncbi:hypothetical protein LTR17_022039 [Elasticomyces elasticus]|nr:hypothetical protein LTR17_022039 [Elasticomyces elasticus]
MALRSYEHIFIFNANLEDDAIASYVSTVHKASGHITTDIQEADLIFTAATKLKRIMFDLRTKGIWTDKDITLSGEKIRVYQMAWLRELDRTGSAPGLDQFIAFEGVRTPKPPSTPAASPLPTAPKFRESMSGPWRAVWQSVLGDGGYLDAARPPSLPRANIRQAYKQLVAAFEPLPAIEPEPRTIGVRLAWNTADRFVSLMRVTGLAGDDSFNTVRHWNKLEQRRLYVVALLSEVELDLIRDYSEALPTGVPTDTMTHVEAAISTLRKSKDLVLEGYKQIQH